MKFTVQKEFARALSTIHKAIDVKAKGGMPLLNHLLIDAKADQTVEVTGTDLTTSIRLTLPAEVATPGRLALPGQKLGEVLNAMPQAAKIQLALGTDQQVELTCERSKVRLKGLGTEEYPPFPQAPTTPWITLPAAQFADLVGFTEFAVGIDATRYALTGIQVFGSAETLRFAATNGHRLAIATYPQTNGHQAIDVIVPPRALSTAARLALETGGDIAVGFTEGKEHLILAREGFLIASRLIDGSYPNLEAVIPANPEHGVEITREGLRSALRRINAILKEDQAARLEPQDGLLVVAGQNAELGDASEEIDCTLLGAPVTVFVRPKYLLEYLDRCPAETVRLYITGALSPIVVRAAGTEGFTYIVMPVHGV